MGDNIQLFEDQPIRAAWDEEKEEWYFSVVDVVGVLTEQETPRAASNYWAKLKQRLKEEGADELLTNCQQLKMKASDGKNRQTDVVGNARKELEMITGQAVITSQNATELNKAVIEMIETSVHME